MRKVLGYARDLGLTVVSHAEDDGLTGRAVATAGEAATRMGLASAPSLAEPLAIARDLMLAEETGARLHVRQVTTAAGFDRSEAHTSELQSLMRILYAVLCLKKKTT